MGKIVGLLGALIAVAALSEINKQLTNIPQKPTKIQKPKQPPIKGQFKSRNLFDMGDIF